jgi:CheY-like chemotaxis protein
MKHLQTDLLQAVAGHGRTVFVVDDNELVRDMVCMILEGEGLRVVQADGPVQALELMECFETPPDLMICDICMPGMTGPELYQKVEKYYPEQPVLFISAYPDEYLRNKCRIVREDRLLRKPFGSADLVERVGLLLRDDELIA